MDALELLTSQHREIDRLFDDLLTCEQARRIECFRRLASALTQHAILESTHFYPALQHQGAFLEVNEALQAHEEAKYLLENVCAVRVGQDGFHACIEALRETVDQHVRDEEQRLFPLARERLGEERLEALLFAMRGTLRLWEEYQPPSEASEPPPWLSADPAAPGGRT